MMRTTIWAIIDQGLTSLTNLLVSLFIARTVDSTSFGAFAVSYAFVILAQGVNRAAVCEAQTVHRTHRARLDPRAMTGASLLVAAAFAVPLAGASLVVPDGTLGTGLLACGFVTPGVLVSDTLRYIWITEGRPGAAIFLDVLWIVGQGALLAVAAVRDVDSIFFLISSIAVSVGAASGIAMVRIRAFPSAALGLDVLRSHLRLSLSLSLDILLAVGATQVVVWGVATLAGLPAAGSLRAAQLLFGPLTPVLTGLRTVALTEAATRHREGQPLGRFLLLVGLGPLVISAVWGASLLALPADAGRLLLGDSWPSASDLLGFITIERAFVGLTLGGVVGLRVLNQGGATARTRAIASLVVVGLGLTGAVAGAAQGAAAGLALAGVVAAALWWYRFRTASRPAS